MPAPLLMNATGRVGLVTGAAGGIGRAVAALLRDAGAQVVGFDQVPAPGNVSVVGNAAKERDVEIAVARALVDFGRLDFVVHAVGVTGGGPIAQQSTRQWKELIDINLTSAFLLSRAVQAELGQSQGSLVLISSTNGRNGGSETSGAPYAVAKAGILNLTRYLAKEWAAQRIRVNCLLPGPVATPMLDRLSPDETSRLQQSIPLGRYASAEEVAAAACFLCSHHAASITGACMNISGGLVLD